MRHTLFIILFAGVLVGRLQRAESAELPLQLSPDDINQVVRELCTSGATRLLRSAEAYPKFWPGIKLGVEFDFLFAGALENLGNGVGSVPSFIPQPKFYLSKGLFYGFELVFSFFPSNIMSTLGSTGGILKWTFYDEKTRDLSLAAFAGYTALSGLSNSFSGGVFEAGAVGSKDYVRLRPYVGAGFLYGTGSVPIAYAATTVRSGSTLVIHSFAGCEFNLPVSISAQVDLYNLTPRAALFFGKKF